MDLELCTSITDLNLKNNQIEEEENITSFLSCLYNLENLNLIGNPIYKQNDYKQLINTNIPSLKNLDIDDDLDSDVNYEMNSKIDMFNTSSSKNNLVKD